MYDSMPQASSILPAGAYRAELRAAVRAARAGARAAMPFYGEQASRAKDDGSPVTAADEAAHRAIARVLAREFPADAVLSEEARDPAGRMGARRVWIVDPLDGTREFLARNGEFAVMVGLAVDGRAVAGAVVLPATGVLYAAAQGQGAWVAHEGRRRRLRARPAPAGAPRLVGSRSHPDPLLVTMQEALGITDVRPAGSVGIKCALVAEGERDLYVHPVPYLKEWDTCAPEVVLREAGGTVTDCRGEPLAYNKADPRQPHGILAAAPGVAERAGPVLMRVYAEAAGGGP
ncbi:MAG TPA: 3'(2'),5'-bisphosphate nucleotidase CysQ [Longimicrobium sp.]